ncbi:hypothetical protein G3N57_01795 [Paraburkholderia sp. Se-20369]|nr:hypothetical protein [Paraburkholderia sp. Se-20369]
MDAYIQVALIEKSKKVFALDAGLFLSFPVVTPVGFQPSAFAAILAPQSAADYAAAADFSRVVNFVPRDQVATVDGENFLWDIYGDVLAHAQSATARDDPVAESRHAAAQALLYQVDPDGTRHETAAYLAYRSYRDAWFTAQEDYNAHRITGEAATDPAEHRYWHDVVEPQLRGAVDQALADWQTLGRRTEIEAALAAEITNAANDPGPRWAQWQAGFNPDIDLVNAGPVRFAPTGYSPTDITGANNWLSTSMSTAEIDALVASAPAELHVEGSGTVEEVSFEYRSVSVTRPWFDSAALTSRIWRGPAESEVLSDGGDPPAGRLPAYVAAIVLIRNVVIKPKAQAPAVATGPLRFTLAPTLLTRRAITLSPMVMMQTSVLPADTPTTPSPPARPFLRLQRQSFNAVAATRAPTATMARMIAPAALVSTETATATATVTPLIARRPMIDIAAFRRGPLIVGHADASEPTPTPPPDETISVLAFVCKRLPKAPDPLPDLIWN